VSTGDDAYAYDDAESVRLLNLNLSVPLGLRVYTYEEGYPRQTSGGWPPEYERTDTYTFVGWVVDVDDYGRWKVSTEESDVFDKITFTPPSDVETSVLTNFGDPFGVSYPQLAGTEDITVKTKTDNEEKTYRIYQLLNNALADSDETARGKGPFYPVTTETADHYSVGGKYSYPPTVTRPELAGLSYPFPTILTRDGAHIHYGGWPAHGIERFIQNDDDTLTAQGGKPVDLDLLGASSRTEILKLTDGVKTGGTWAVMLLDEAGNPVAIDPETAGIDANVNPVEDSAGTSELTITGKAEATYILQVSYTLTGSKSYTLNTTVNVTAGLFLDPDTVQVFPGDNVTVTLNAVTSGGVALPGTLALGEDVSSRTESYLIAERSPKELGEGVTTKQVHLTTTAEAAPGPVYIDVPYTFTHTTDAGSREYTRRPTLLARIIDLPTPVFTPGTPDETTKKVPYTAEIDFGSLVAEDGTTPLGITLNSVSFADAEPPAGVTLKYPAADGELNKIALEYSPVDAPADGEDPVLPKVTLTVQLTMDGLSHTLTMPVHYTAPAEPEALAEVLALAEEVLDAQAETETPAPTEAIVPENAQDNAAGQRRRALRHQRRRRAGKHA